jgi:hypothetical protein
VVGQVPPISLQGFGILGVFALAVVTVFKLYTALVEKQREGYEKQIADLQAACAKWEVKAWELALESRKAREVAGQAIEVAKGAVEIAEKKAAQ